jgi:hypothetical protein
VTSASRGRQRAPALGGTRAIYATTHVGMPAGCCRSIRSVPRLQAWCRLHFLRKRRPRASSDLPRCLVAVAVVRLPHRWPTQCGGRCTSGWNRRLLGASWRASPRPRSDAHGGRITPPVVCKVALPRVRDAICVDQRRRSKRARSRGARAVHMSARTTCTELAREANSERSVREGGGART